MVERVFIDATYTLASGKNSGIERVVRNILGESATLGREGRMPVPQLVLSLDGKFFSINAKQIAYFSKTAAMHSNVLSMTPAVYRTLAEGTRTAR